MPWSAAIDMHAHYYGGPLPEALAKRTGRPSVRKTAAGTLEMMAMNGAFPFTAAHTDAHGGIEAMRAQGITKRLLTFPGALGVDTVPDVGIAPVIAAFNSHLAELQQQTGGALVGLAGVPLCDFDLAVAELTRVRRELELPGIILPADYFRSVAEAKTLEPVLDAANAQGCLIMLHPGLKVGETPPARPTDWGQYRVSAVDLQSSLSQAALTVALSDLLDIYPNIAFQVVNLGGTLPFIFERIEAIARHRTAENPFPTERLRRIWYDCASLGPRALEAAVALYGADRIMLGSDFPIFHDNPLDQSLTPANLSEAEKDQIAWRTAQDFLGRFIS